MSCLILWPLDMRRCRYSAQSQRAMLDIPMNVRWQIRARLDQLAIHAICEKDGTLSVEVDNGVAIAQIHSVVRQATGARSTLVNWLELCWAQPMTTSAL